MFNVISLRMLKVIFIFLVLTFQSLATKIYGSSGQWVNSDEIFAEAWAQYLDEDW